MVNNLWILLQPIFLHGKINYIPHFKFSMVVSVFFPTHHGEEPAGPGVMQSWARDVAPSATPPAGDVCISHWPAKPCSLVRICWTVVSGLPLCKLIHRNVEFIQAEKLIFFTLV